MSVGGALVERCTAMHQETTNQTAAPGSEQRGAEVSGLRLLHRYFFPHHPEKAITLTLYPHVASNYQREKTETGAAEATHCLQCLSANIQQSGTQAAQRQMCCSCSSCSCPAGDDHLAQKAKQQLGTLLAKFSIAVQGLPLGQV